MRKRKLTASFGDIVRDVLAVQSEDYVSYFCLVELERALFKSTLNCVKPVNHLKICILFNLVES